MKNLSAIFSLSVFLLLFISCDDLDISAGGEITTEVYDLNTFDEITVALPANVYITQDGNERLEIETHENLFEVIDVNVSSGELKIDTDANIRNITTLNIYVQVDNLYKIKMSGSGNLFTYDCLTSPQLEATLSGSGEINLCGNIEDLRVKLSGSGMINLNSIEANAILTDVTGSGEVNVSGTSTNVTYLVTGSGDIKGFNLQGTVGTINISGSGDIECSFSNSLDIGISGSGNVRYKGDPQITSNVTGSGTISKMD
jgi:hypothetical protein